MQGEGTLLGTRRRWNLERNRGVEMKRQFTSEAVTAGHPDKVCDQMADAVLDELLRQDPLSRCAVDVAAAPGGVHIMGEVTTRADVDYEETARKVIRDIGYTRPEYGFDDGIRIDVSIHEQSKDIALGVDSPSGDGSSAGAGDQGMMFGYASSETDTLMPFAADLARGLVMNLTAARKSGQLGWLRPDGKSQVTVEYDDGKPSRVSAVVLSAQHDPDIPVSRLREELMETVIRRTIPADMMDGDTRIHINPTGRFVLGGPAADTGLTGRKIIADTYGGYARHGGGAFSGKDPSKVDRSAALMLRHIARTIVASGAADECEIQVAYAIGVSEPVSLSVDTFSSGRVDEQTIREWILDCFDLSPAGIISRLDLLKPVYRNTAENGPFGWNDRGYPWECVDVEASGQLKSLCLG